MFPVDETLRTIKGIGAIKDHKMEDRIGKLIWRLNARLKFGLHYSENEESLKVYELRNDTIRVELQKDHLWVERMRDWNERETGS